MPTRATTNITIAHWRLLYRTQTSYSAKPASAAEWTTFLATFTEAGYIESGVKWKAGRGDSVVLDDGTKHVLGYNGELSGKLLQIGEADFETLIGIEGSDYDFLLVDDDNQRALVVLDGKMYFDVEFTGGELQSVPFIVEFENKQRSVMYDYFDIPQA